MLNASNSGQSEAVTFTPTDTTDYTTASATATVNVAQATPTVVSVNPVNITYGTALDNGQLSGTASWTVNGSLVPVAGTFTYTSAAGTVLNASNSGQSEAVTFTPTDTTDYTTASATATVNVAQAPPTVVSVNPVNITYGTALDNGQLSGTASWTVNGSLVPVAGTFTYTSAAGTVLNASNSGQSEAVTFTPTDTTDYTTASATATVNVAQAPPTVVSVNPVNITYGTALDNGQLSGTTSWTVNGSLVPVAGTFTYTGAAGTVLNASNSGQSEAVTFTPTDTTDYTTASATATVNVAQAPPTVVSVNPVNITYGTALDNGQLSGTASWTVNGSLVPVAGTFTYTSAAGTVLNASNSGQSEAVTFTPTDTTDYTTVSATATVNVAQATPTVVSVNPVNITYGTALDNGQLSGTASWTVNGSLVPVAGTFTYTSAAGTVLNASNSGQSEAVTFTPADTTDYTSTTATATINVAQASTTTTLTSDTNPSVFGQSVTFTATVAASSGSGTPTGMVDFLDGDTPLGFNALTAGEATFTTSSLTVATHSITVAYFGDTNFITSISPIVSQVVNQASTTTTLTASPNPIVFGQSVTFTATVAAVSPGSGTPTGTVTFDDNGTPLGTGTLSSGVAAFSTSILTAGTQSITAVYSDDANFTTSTSNVVSQVVKQVSTTTTLISSTNPSAFGQSVTFTATVAAVSPGTGTATGQVVFYDGTTPIDTEYLSGGRRRTPRGPLGERPLDHRPVSRQPDFGGSTSTAFTQTVNQDQTSTVLASSLDPAVSGQSVTFTATVAAKAPGSGTPTGTVTFYDGTTAIDTEPLVGRGELHDLSLAVGTHPISAVYGSDTNFIGSTSADDPQTIKQASTATVTSSVNPTLSGQSVTFTANVSATRRQRARRPARSSSTTTAYRLPPASSSIPWA